MFLKNTHKLEYKWLMLIPMAGVIVTRLSSNSFEELLILPLIQSLHRMLPCNSVVDVNQSLHRMLPCNNVVDVHRSLHGYIPL